ncbi:sensor histidine kinase [Sporofaciens musculi]|jgi:signal transduction histidine kinase|uniref:sensor histidine kinase n=1 Tax=Sporofaciens musculi TaxID=2681861 RepID=UPI00257018C7|nr:HAMP domain-containing sensor histidine kinase [Sporofaciens musculi]
MRSTLYLKFVIVYVIFGFLSIFIVATLTFNLTESPLEIEMATSLYREANLFANHYLPSYFSEGVDDSQVHLQLSGIEIQLEAAVWFVDKDGVMISSAVSEEYPSAPYEIEAFDPVESKGSQYQIGDYHEYFEEDVITVIAPVVYSYSPKGYLLIHKYVSDSLNPQKILLRASVITVFVIYILSFMVLLAFQYFVYLPLRKITEAATQYALGNLEYEIPVNTEDEMGYLSASLNYMSSQLRDMEDYQKKFVANVSHDFRSPLTSIKGYVEAMADGTIPPELHEKYLKIILFETERLTDLTQDLLTLNEFDTKNMLLNKEVFDIHEMIRNVAASFEGTCKQKKISIEVIFPPKKLSVNGDKRKIQQVLYNLLDNAIKFSEPDSVVTIETTERGEKVYTSVKDDGIGIPRTSLNKIWERFYKSDLSRGKDKKGTGLGLAIVKEAIQAHGENINVVSTEGVGTEFIFSLPRG